MNRRQALTFITNAMVVYTHPAIGMQLATKDISKKPTMPSKYITLFLCGDVMTGRGIDQVMPHPSDPILFEPYVNDATEYVTLAERVHGPIPKPVDFAYIWGDALSELRRFAPDVRIINLETSVTTSNQYWPGKGINYRMHPQNIPCLSAAEIDCCVLANNHVLDWGYDGLTETLATLQKANIHTAGAGRNIKDAQAPAILETAGRTRAIVFSFAMASSGVPRQWAADVSKPGVNFLEDLSAKTVSRISSQVQTAKQTGDIVVVSIHWGGNWGYHIPLEHIEFAHELIDTAGVDIIHGHSSHHPIAMEVYKDKPILYGCGDFLNDYEGISGYEQYRGDLALMYFVRMEVDTGRLASVEMVPTQLKGFKSNRASGEDSRWLQRVLNKECGNFKGRVELNKESILVLHW